MTYTEQVLAALRDRDAHETEFLQAVSEVFETIEPVLARHPHYQGANMPSTLQAAHLFIRKGILYAPSKAANAGGVATSGLEMSQNSMRTTWSFAEVDSRLQRIMQAIHSSAYAAAADYDMAGNYVAGANIAAFVKVADAMVEQGLV